MALEMNEDLNTRNHLFCSGSLCGKTDEEHGYDAVFDPEIDSKYTCPVCLTAMRDPLQTKCGHRFCTPCLLKTSGLSRYAKCPFDNTWYDKTKDIFNDNAFKREILSLTVKCDFHENGCHWKGELRDLENHKTGCPEQVMECTNKCGFSTKRWLLDNHLEKCPRKEIVCEDCSVKLWVTKLTKHKILECPKTLLRCTLCSAGPFPRNEINNHIDVDDGNCPFTIVPCTYKHLGCKHMDMRNNIADHCKNSTSYHLKLLFIQKLQLEKKHNYLENDVNDLKQVLQEVKETICGSHKKRIRYLENAVGTLKRQLRFSRENIYSSHVGANEQRNEGIGLVTTTVPRNATRNATSPSYERVANPALPLSRQSSTSNNSRHNYQISTSGTQRGQRVIHRSIRTNNTIRSTNNRIRRLNDNS